MPAIWPSGIRTGLMCPRPCGSDAKGDHPAVGLAASKVSTAEVAVPLTMPPMSMTFVEPEAGPGRRTAPSPLPCFSFGQV